MSKIAYVSKLPACNFCSEDAKYDFRMSNGSWAYGCEKHWKDRRAHVNLGTGFGQELVAGEEQERTDNDIRKDVAAAVAAGDWDALEDAIGDRDPIEFL